MAKKEVVNEDLTLAEWKALEAMKFLSKNDMPIRSSHLAKKLGVGTQYAYRLLGRLENKGHIKNYNRFFYKVVKNERKN